MNKIIIVLLLIWAATIGTVDAMIGNKQKNERNMEKLE